MITSHLLSAGPGFGGLGAVTLTPEQYDLVGKPLESLANQEKFLRQSAERLAKDVGTLARAGRALPPTMIDLLRNHNAAVMAHKNAAMVFIEARQNIASSDLPDPGAKPVTIPTFGGFDIAGYKAVNVTVKYGVLNQEQSVPVLNFTSTPTSSGLGQPAVVFERLLGLLIVTAIVVYAYDVISSNSTKRAEFAASVAVANNTTKVSQIDSDIYQRTLNACSAANTDFMFCVDKALEALRTQKEGRPKSPTPISEPLFVFGAVAALGLVSWFAYRGYLRKKGGTRGGRMGRMGPTRPVTPRAYSAKSPRPAQPESPDSAGGDDASSRFSLLELD